MRARDKEGSSRIEAGRSGGGQKSLVKRLRERLCLPFDQSGQSAVEYGFIASVTAIAFWVGRPMWMALIEGLQVYFDSFYFVLRLPIP